MNMHVDKSRHRGLAGGFHFDRARRQAHIGTRSDRLDNSIAYQDAGIRNFSVRCDGFRGVQQNCGHGRVNIVAEIELLLKIKTGIC